MVFGQEKSNWIRLYPVLGEPDSYFDFAYSSTQAPTDLAELLDQKFGPCELIDWSPGRFATILVKGPDKNRLANAIGYLAEARFRDDARALIAYYVEQRPA